MNSIVQRAVRDELPDGALARHDAAGDRPQVVRELHHVGDRAGRLREHRLVVERRLRP